jgi:ATP-dependent Clp protease ATP-binding subunit ClpA
MEGHYKLTVDDAVLKLIVDLSAEEIKNRSFPDKAIDIMEKCFSRSVLDGKKSIDELTVKEIVGEFVGIKFLDTEDDKGKRLLQMEKFLKERVYGQDHVIDRICKIIRLSKQKLDLHPEKPDGVFFFGGSSGVGKTYLAKQIASFLYGAEDKLFVLNMSEFSESHSVSKLIGSPAGYIGYDDNPFFSAKILENPSCVLLLDEIEKAHLEVVKLFLQIFDEGKITDTKGRVIYFANVTIIMTSNALGVTEKKVGFVEKKGEASADLTSIFPPEFVNRITEVIVFNSIDRETARRILHDLMIPKTIKTFEKKGIELKIDPLFEDYVLEKGFSRRFGVRNLERVYEQEVLSAISNYLFANPDARKIHITLETGKVNIK